MRLGGFMNTAQSRLSLRELRGKTDRELVILVGRETERSLKLARQGAIAEAEAIYLQAKVLLGIARAPGRNPEGESHIPPSQGFAGHRPRAGSAALRDGGAPGPDARGYRTPPIRPESLRAIGLLLRAYAVFTCGMRASTGGSGGKSVYGAD